MDEPGLVESQHRGPDAPVFVSYATSDRKEALALCRAIERRGARCWISCRDVEPGENYQEAIVGAIESARAMVLVFSSAANKSDEIKKELSLASRCGVTVIAVRIEDVEPSRAFAYELSTRQWIDAFVGRTKALDMLVGRIERLAGPSPPGEAVPGAGSAPRRATVSRRKAMLIAAAALLLLLAAAATAYWLRGPREGVSLAVIPFADLSPARDKAYFAEGVAEEILSTLAAEQGIKVLGRTSAAQIQRNPDPRAIRSSLGVTHLLEGSTRTAGNDLRVNVRLIDTSDGSRLWEEEYSGALADVFSVQDQIATAVVRRLRGTLLAGAVRAAEPTSVDAYESYLAARAIIRQNKREAIERAQGMARRIVEAHPDYAPGHALYAETTMLLSDGFYGYGDLPVAKAREVALAHARRAIRLTPRRAEGYAAIGLALPIQDSIAPYRKALSLDPSRSDVRLRLAIALDILKRPDEAFEQYRQAIEMEPLAPAVLNRYIQILGSSGRTAEALRAIDSFVSRTGLDGQGWRFRGAIYAYQTDFSRAVAARRRALQLDSGLPYQRDWLAMYFHLLGLDAAQYRTGIPVYIAGFVADDHAALKQRLIAEGAGAWDTNGVEFAIFSLARARDWPAIVRFYRLHPDDRLDPCLLRPSFAPIFALAFKHAGQGAQADRLLKCAQGQVTSLLKMRYRSPDDAPGELEMTQASILALRNERSALDWLDKAVGRGWVGQYYSSDLGDWPQFDGLRGDPRYAGLQQRISAAIARERSEVLAGR